MASAGRLPRRLWREGEEHGIHTDRQRGAWSKLAGR